MRIRICAAALALFLALALPGAAMAEELDALQGLLDELGGAEHTSVNTPPLSTSGDEAGAGVAQADYPLMDGFDLTTLNDTVAVQVPSAWWSNAGVSEAMVSYSPSSRSGVMDVTSSTLSTIWYIPDKPGALALEEYCDNLRKEDTVSGVQSEPVSLAGQEGVALTYDITVGTNTFSCRTACFAYHDFLYAMEMDQGGLCPEDYFPVFDKVTDSAVIMAGSWQVEQAAPGETPVPTAVPVPDVTNAPTVAPTVTLTAAPTAASTAEPAPDATNVPTAAPAAGSQGADLGSFAYAINGHSYAFPTKMGVVAEGDLNVDMTLVLSHEQDPAAAGDALVNTLYFVLERFPTREMIGVSNLTQGNAPMAEGVLTALVDTQADAVRLELPGGLRVGSAEADILSAFPEFDGWPMDGLAGFRGNELLYACNVRDDGCNGYVIIRNDAPYCSALSIICESGAIREINFQCLGAATANGIFG